MREATRKQIETCRLKRIAKWGVAGSNTCVDCRQNIGSRATRCPSCSSKTIHTGRKRSTETRVRMSLAQLKGREPKTLMNKRYHTTPEWVAWRKQVYQRDSYTCQVCKTKSGMGHTVRLEPHHIFSVALFPALVFVVDNGLTLCYDCHSKTRGRYKTTKELR